MFHFYSVLSRWICLALLFEGRKRGSEAFVHPFNSQQHQSDIRIGEQQYSGRESRLFVVSDLETVIPSKTIDGTVIIEGSKFKGRTLQHQKSTTEQKQRNLLNIV